MFTNLPRLSTKVRRNIKYLDRMCLNYFLRKSLPSLHFYFHSNTVQCQMQFCPSRYLFYRIFYLQLPQIIRGIRSNFCGVEQFQKGPQIFMNTSSHFKHCSGKFTMVLRIIYSNNLNADYHFRSTKEFLFFWGSCKIRLNYIVCNNSNVRIPILMSYIGLFK